MGGFVSTEESRYRDSLPKKRSQPRTKKDYDSIVLVYFASTNRRSNEDDLQVFQLGLYSYEKKRAYERATNTPISPEGWNPDTGEYTVSRTEMENDILQGYYKTEEDAMYAYNTMQKELVSKLAEDKKKTYYDFLDDYYGARLGTEESSLNKISPAKALMDVMTNFSKTGAVDMFILNPDYAKNFIERQNNLARGDTMQYLYSGEASESEWKSMQDRLRKDRDNLRQLYIGSERSRHFENADMAPVTHETLQLYYEKRRDEGRGSLTERRTTEYFGGSEEERKRRLERAKMPFQLTLRVYAKTDKVYPSEVVQEYRKKLLNAEPNQTWFDDLNSKKNERIPKIDINVKVLATKEEIMKTV